MTPAIAWSPQLVGWGDAADEVRRLERGGEC
jgi:hypothetical protein